MTLRQEGDNLIVEGVVEHSIYPTRHEEIAQTVMLNGDYTVLGGIYARVLKTSGTGSVHGPVVVREDLFLDQRSSVGQDTFLSGLTVPGTIRNEARFTVRRSSVADLKEARLRIRGPVFADTVHLTNALIIGNIHARRVTLEGCIVFGVIECEELLVMNCCTFAAYRAGRAKLMGRLSTWLGYGISHDGLEFMSASPERPHIEPSSDTDGPIPPDLRYLPICLSGHACDREDYFEACDDYHSGACPSCVSGKGPMDTISLRNIDFRVGCAIKDGPKVDVQVQYRKDGRTVEDTIDFSGVPLLVGGDVDPATLMMETPDGSWVLFHEHPVFRERCIVTRVLSVAGRLLDGRALEQSLKSISELARTIAYYPYLDASSREEVQQRKPERKGTLELFSMGTAVADIRHAS